MERIYLKPRFGFPYPKVLTMKKWVEIKLLNKVAVQWNFEKSSKMAKTVGWKLDFAAYPLLQSNSICLLSFSTYSVMHIAAFTLDNFWKKNMKPISDYIAKLRYLHSIAYSLLEIDHCGILPTSFDQFRCTLFCGLFWL